MLCRRAFLLSWLQRSLGFFLLMKRILFLYYCWIAAIGTAWAQDEIVALDSYSVQVWSTDEGLPSNNLRQVFQDHDGFIWITSFNGLMRFDGHTFDIYSSDNIPGLKSNGFSALAEDGINNLYIGTLTSGLLKYTKGEFRLYQIENAFSKPISYLLPDSKGNLWIGTGQSGLYILPHKKDTVIKQAHALLENATINCLSELKNGAIWIATEKKGIIVYDSSGFHQDTTLASGPMAINCIAQHGDKVYAGTANGTYYLHDNHWHLIEGTKNVYVNQITFDKLGSMWMACETGLYRLLPNGYVESLSEEDGLPSRQVSSVIIDSENNVWLTTKRGGLALLRKSNFINISPENGLSSRFINTVYGLQDGTMLFGTDNGQLNYMRQGKIGLWPLKTDLTNISIKDILQDSRGTIWLATYKGVIKLANGKETLLSTAQGMPSDNTRCLFEDTTGNIWVGAKDGGLTRIAPDGTKSIYNIENGLSKNYVFCVEQLPNGNILVGTLQGGVNIIKPDGGIEVLNIHPDNSSPVIFNIEPINDNEYWLATDVGLYKFAAGKFYKIDKETGLPVRTIFDVHQDDNGYLWLTSNLGVVRAEVASIERMIHGDVSKIIARLYDDKDGMLERECTGATKMFVDKNDNLWIPTSGGVSVVDPNNILVNLREPPVFIKEVLVDGVPVEGDKEVIEIGPGAQRLTIKYTALSYYAPGKIHFRYRLRGFEKDWNEVGNVYEANYMNLPDGNFVFEVMAANNDGVWNEVPATVELSIAPYFYQSRLFILVMVLILLLVAFIIYWIRIRVVEEKNKELRKLNTELDSFVYSVSHDLRAPLASILGLINVSKIDRDSGNLPLYMEKIEKSVLKLDNFIRDIINYSRNVRLQVEAEEVDIKELVEEILDDLSYLDSQGLVQVNITSTKKTKITTDRTRLKIVLSNLISNAYRYRKMYISDPRIDINIRVTDSFAEIKISDNGIGILPDRKEKIFEMFYRATDSGNGSGLGLYIAKESVLKMEGRIEVESEYERGTTFTVIIPSL